MSGGVTGCVRMGKERQHRLMSKNQASNYRSLQAAAIWFVFRERWSNGFLEEEKGGLCYDVLIRDPDLLACRHATESPNR